MFDEEESVKKPTKFELGQNLEELAVEELTEIIELLHSEITRLEEAKTGKSAHLSAAEALFSKK